MNKLRQKSVQTADPRQRAVLASPLRLEILGLFTGPEALSVADMAGLMGRSAGSLYHHVGLLEEAGLLYRSGTRPKGKRHEALFRPIASRIEIEASSGGSKATDQAVKTIASAFRMAERDLAAALHREENLTRGPDRNLFATRMHMRASRELLRKINKHLLAIENLLASEASRPPAPSPDDQHLSLTVALLPLKGRGKDKHQQGG